MEKVEARFGSFWKKAIFPKVASVFWSLKQAVSWLSLLGPQMSSASQNAMTSQLAKNIPPKLRAELGPLPAF